MSKHWLDPQLPWKVFKQIMDRFPDSGIVMVGMDKMLWRMLRERRINLYISGLKKDRGDQVIITINPIKGGKIIGPKTKKK
jgi:hypothetical protein